MPLGQKLGPTTPWVAHSLTSAPPTASAKPPVTPTLSTAPSPRSPIPVVALSLTRSHLQAPILQAACFPPWTPPTPSITPPRLLTLPLAHFLRSPTVAASSVLSITILASSPAASLQKARVPPPLPARTPPTSATSSTSLIISISARAIMATSSALPTIVSRRAHNRSLTIRSIALPLPRPRPLSLQVLPTAGAKNTSTTASPPQGVLGATSPPSNL